MDNLNWGREPSPQQEEPYSTRVSTIEKQLNKLCCQHDSYMPLLELNVYESALYRWDNWVKLVNKRIGELEGFVGGVAAGQDRRVGLAEGENQVRMAVLGRIKDSVEEIRACLQGSTVSQVPSISQFGGQAKLIHSLYEQSGHQPQSTAITSLDPLAQLQQQSSQALSQLKKYTEISLALFKNEVLVSSYSPSTSSVNPNLSPLSPPPELSPSQQQTVQKFASQFFYPLQKEIQYLRSSFSDQDLRDFHLKTMERLSCDIVELEEVLAVMEGEAEGEGGFLADLPVVREKVELIGWQIKGMRKKYFQEINRLYQTEQDSYGVSTFEKQVQKDIKLLEVAHKQLKSKLQTLTL